MKLIRCKACGDVVRLIEKRWRMCECGKSGGQYNVDFMSATVGGKCDILGLSNLMFDKKYRKLTEEEKIAYKKKINHHYCEVWFGELLGDKQIIRIKSPKGPRINAKVRWNKKSSTLIISDDRDYSLNLPGDRKPRTINIEENSKPRPSFKNKIKKNDSRSEKSPRR